MAWAAEEKDRNGTVTGLGEAAAAASSSKDSCGSEGILGKMRKSLFNSDKDSQKSE